MIYLKSKEEIALLREAGRVVALTHQELKKHLKPGISTYELDMIAEEFIRSKGCTPSFKGYGGQVDFQIGFAKGKYHAFTALKHGETAQGKTAMEKLPDLVPTLSIGSDLTDLSVVTASSFTGMPIAEIVQVCKADYLAWYNA